MNQPIIVTATSLLVVCCHVASWAHRQPSPNVVLIISDDQAWTDFGFMKHPVIETPNLDRLAREGVLFTRGYVPTSLCRASLATIISGRFPHQHRLTSNDPPRGTDRRVMLRQLSAADTLPRLLARRGYLSFQAGKWWEGNYALGGFTHGMTHGDPARGGRHGDEGLRIGREGLESVFNFIDECGERPFFLWYAPMLPHTPHNPPPRLLAKYSSPERPEKLARYFAMCEWFDETCGALIDHLDRHELSDNTLVVFVVDNGWIQEVGPRKTTRGWFAPKSKLSPYDGGVRTPIILRMPGTIRPARFDEQLVSSIDLAPTILTACGGEIPPDMPGINLMQVIDSGSPVPRTLYGELFTHDAIDVDRPAANLTHRFCVDGWWKLIVPSLGTANSELYDLKADPTETRNLAAGHSDLVERLRMRLDTWYSGK